MPRYFGTLDVLHIFRRSSNLRRQTNDVLVRPYCDVLLELVLANGTVAAAAAAAAVAVAGAGAAGGDSSSATFCAAYTRVYMCRVRVLHKPVYTNRSLRAFQNGKGEYSWTMCSKNIIQLTGGRKFLKTMSGTTSKQFEINSKASLIRRWKLAVPIGIGVSLIALLQWKHLRKYRHIEKETQGLLNDFIVNCYCCLPLRITSRIWGWIANREVPVNLRTSVYGFYAKTFHANLEEIANDLAEFPTLVDFFVRPLKEGVRPIDKNAAMVSPADGTVLHFGPVTSCRVEQVKGVTYDLRHFLGDIDQVEAEKRKYTDEENKRYVKSLLKNPDSNQLYQLTVYLAPGDYHRFHSPTDWEIESRRHFQGKLLSVNPRIVSFLPDLFSLNERVVYIGKWAEGFMAYAAMQRWEDANLGCIRLYKGQLFGEFRMGSTIVLLFEASKDFRFSLKLGQTVKVGHALTECTEKSDEKYLSQSL
ncbi:hypothetical protein KPH14_012359 [Odynerus spinipes]|uniref:phosphatidylserine decarboxylase n=1 Tax=Odynerus spinipes TaxID=1348599 RepID=A0AAD9RI18_9HYME|nr:hypothetical protein KPH14_012359 [Odynerus spinipes]